MKKEQQKECIEKERYKKITIPKLRRRKKNHKSYVREKERKRGEEKKIQS
jgi:hypothetical protein